MKYLLLLITFQAFALDGPALFAQNCVLCHGPKGLGDGVAASSLNPRPRNLMSDPFKNGDTVEQIEKTLKSGLNQMPAFTLSDEDKTKLAEFVKSLRSK